MNHRANDRGPARNAAQWHDERYRAVIDLGPLAVYSCDAAGVIQDFNRRAVELWGRQPVLGDTDERFCGSFKLFRPDGTFMPHDASPMAEVVAGTLSEAREAEVHIERPDGSRIAVVVNIRPVRDHRGDVIGAINCFYDVTGQKETEAALRAREAELALVINQTPFMLTRCSRDLRYQFVSQSYADMMGRQPADIVGKAIVDIMGDKAFETIRPYIETVLQGPRVEFDADLPYDGAGLRSVRVTYVPDRDGGGQVRGWIASILDVTEGTQVEKERALLAGIVDSSDDAIISKTLDGTITSWNTGAQRMFGYAPIEAIGRSIAIIIPPDRRNEETEIAGRLSQGHTIEQFETERVTKDGRRVPISLTVSPVRNRHGVVIGASKIARDITDRVRADEEREHLLTSERRARAEAEQANRGKDEFVATVSHELRTPLNAILGWAAILEQTAPPDSRALKGLQSIHRNTQTLARLVDDLLDVSRMISGKMRLDVVPMDLGDVIEAAVETILPAASAKDISIHIDVDPASRRMMGDPTRLQQAIWNLLANAVKFTPARGRVEVSTGVSDGDIQLAVTDSGIGIDPTFLPQVFDRFRQGDGSSTRSHGGLGLGLAIVRHIVELHGGAVRAESDGHNAGTRLVLQLPRKLGSIVAHDERKEVRAASPLTAAEAPRLDGLRILIVDDNRESCEVMLESLRGYGATVCATTSASAAVEALANFDPALVLSDIAMPGQDGYAVLREVRARATALGHRVPVGVVTAYANAEDRERAIAAGFDEFLPKPIDPATLALAVAELAGVNHR